MRPSSLKLLPALVLSLASHQVVAEAPRSASVAERIQLIQAMKDCWTQRTGDGSMKANTGGGNVGLRVDGAFKKLLSVAGDAKGNFDLRTTTWQEFDAIKAPENVDVMLRLCYAAAFGSPPAGQATATATATAASPRASPRSSPVRIKAASIDKMDVSPDVCLAKTPCGGLKRGSALHLELTGAGYAAAYIQDKGAFFNQEGRLAINGGHQGDVGLYPGTDGMMDGSIYVLYVVLSGTRIPTTPDSEGLDQLPRGEQFGPIYLRTRAE